MNSHFAPVRRPHVDHPCLTKWCFSENCLRSSVISLCHESTFPGRSASHNDCPPCSTALSLVSHLNDFSLPFSSTNIPCSTAVLLYSIKPLSYPSLPDSTIKLCKMMRFFIAFTIMDGSQNFHDFLELCHQGTKTPNALYILPHSFLSRQKVALLLCFCFGYAVYKYCPLGRYLIYKVRKDTADSLVNLYIKPVIILLFKIWSTIYQTFNIFKSLIIPGCPKVFSPNPNFSIRHCLQHNC